MTLRTLNKTITATKIEVTYKQGERYECWHIDYLERGNSRHYDNLHYVCCMGELPAEVMKRKVMFVDVNQCTHALGITLEDKEV